MSPRCRLEAMNAVPDPGRDRDQPAAWEWTDSGVASFSAPGVFCPGREGFCRTLAGEAARLPGVARVVVCAASSVWQVEFSPGVPSVADVAADLVRTVERTLPALAPEGGVPGPATAWVAFPDEAGPSSVWEVIPVAPGRYRLRSRRLRGRPCLTSRVAHSLRRHRGVRTCRVRRWSGALEVEIDGEEMSPFDLAATAEGLSRRTRRACRSTSLANGGSRRLDDVRPNGRGRDLLLACGSLVMVAVGVVLPGIPSAPFLFFAAYFAARCWPGLGETLGRYPQLRSALERPLPRPDPWEVAGMAGMAAVAVVAFVAVRPPLPMVLALEMAVAGSSARRWLRRPGAGGRGGAWRPRRSPAHCRPKAQC